MQPTPIVIEYARPGYVVHRFALRFQPRDWSVAMAEAFRVYTQGAITYRDCEAIQRRIVMAVLRCKAVETARGR